MKFGSQGKVRRVRWWLGHPMVCIVLVFFAIMDMLSLPTESVVGQFVRSRRTHCFFGPSAAVFRRDGHIVVADDRRDFDDELLGYTSFRSTTSKNGMWAATSIVTSRIADLGGVEPLSTAERTEFFKSFGNYLLTYRQGAYAADAAVVSAGGMVTRVSSPGGYIHNTISAAVFAAIGLSLVSLRSPESWDQTWVERRGEELSRGRCPSCGYSIVGLPERKCPECGAAWG